MHQILENITDRIGQLAAKINAPLDLLPAPCFPFFDAQPYFLYENGRLIYKRTERGIDRDIRITYDSDELLFWVFEEVTHIMASNYELKNRISGKDGRRIRFSYQEELMSKLNVNWSLRTATEHKVILERAPFDDFGLLRADYAGELRKQGMYESKIMEMVYQKYPKVS